jgi:hypothetical protein
MAARMRGGFKETGHTAVLRLLMIHRLFGSEESKAAIREFIGRRRL